MEAQGRDAKNRKITGRGEPIKFIINGAAFARISDPEDGAIFSQGQQVVFYGRIGDASEAIWTSSIDGEIGTGSSIYTSELSPGTHTVAMELVDPVGPGTSSFAQITVTVTVESGTQPSGETDTFALPGDVTIEMVWIEPGTFVMGTTEEQEQLLRSKGMWDGWFENEHPDHPVTITQGFWLGKYEITQGQWEGVMGTRPWSGGSYVQANADHPAVYISWDDMQEFIRRLNAAEGSEVYRLPTEAEWEYACRGGTTTLWSFGDDESELGHYAWYRDNAWNVGEKYAHAVGTKDPNAWGLYDMHGNVWEWCQDRWDERYYRVSPTEDPQGPSSGSGRVSRGGDFCDLAQGTRSAYRGFYSPGTRNCYIGARLLRQGP